MGVAMLLAVGAALVVVPAAALAQLPPSKSGQAALAAFNSLDRDDDRALTLAELRARGREKGAEMLFVMLDANGNGRLEVKELGVASGAVLARFDAYDVDKNGYVSVREFPNFVDPVLVEALDRDGDGRLALSELRSSFAGARPRAEPVAEGRRDRRAAKPAPPVWCYVTGFGNNKWVIEAPVVWDRCRTH